MIISNDNSHIGPSTTGPNPPTDCHKIYNCILSRFNKPSTLLIGRNKPHKWVYQITNDPYLVEEYSLKVVMFEKIVTVGKKNFPAVRKNINRLKL